MNKPFQRLGAKSNSYVGEQFEIAAQQFFAKQGLTLHLNHKMPVGVGDTKKDHAFDLGCEDQRVIVECKSHRWTSSDKVPSAKLTVWNEAMYYFQASPDNYRKIFFVLYDLSETRGETLAEYYIRRYKHLIPADVELWEYNEIEAVALQRC